MKKASLSILIASALALSAPLSAAEEITYTGNGTGLKNPPAWTGWPAGNYLYPGDGTAATSGNTVTINYAPGTGTDPFRVFGGLSENGNVTNNTVTMNNGQVIQVYGGYSDSGNTTNNTVIINGGSVGGDVYGGYSVISGNANNNTVTINGGTVNNAVYGGFSINGNATNNTVIINGGSVGGDVYGGFSTGNGASSGNTVTINGGTVNNVVYGGRSLNGSATHNTVTIGKNAIITGAELTGGYDASGGDGFTGNTLNIAGQHSPNDIKNFQNLNFTLANDVQGGANILNVANVFLDGAAGTRSSNVTVGIQSGGRLQQVGESYTLINTTNWTNGTIAQDGQTITGMKGMSLLYDFDIAQSGVGGAQTLTATISDRRINPQTHALLSGRAVQTALVNQGADLIVNRGMRNLKQSARSGHQSFFAMQGGTSRMKTGSGIDMDSFSLMAGAAWGTKLSPDVDLALGAFVETGTGSYNSSNSFTGMGSVRGSGNTDFIGVGVLGSLEWANGFYVDASLRGGRVESDLSTSVTLAGERGEYDEASSLYVGAHAGVGYNWAISNVDTLDVYTRYLWTHTDSDSVEVLGDRYRFGSTDSHRWRTGMKYGRTFGGFTPYAGVAYEFEFDGKAGGSVYGYKLKETDMGGSTWIGELGFTWQPKGYENIHLDLSVEGFAGQRDGVMANARFNYRF